MNKFDAQGKIWKQTVSVNVGYSSDSERGKREKPETEHLSLGTKFDPCTTANTNRTL